MLRISAFIAIVMVVGVGPSAARAQTKSTERQCYNAQTCDTECRRSAVGKSCPKICDHQRATLPPCK
jgi:hypothetical protein